MSQAKIYSACGVRKLSAFGLVRQEAHGKRQELQSKNKKVRQKMERRIRDDFDPKTMKRSIAWSKAGAGRELDLRAAWEKHRKQESAITWGKAPIGLHLIAHVSPQWVNKWENEDAYDPENPRLKAFAKQARAWADNAIGGVFATRLDLDERSVCQIDIFAAPVFPPTGKRKNRVILTNKALDRLYKHHNDPTQYGAVQSSWAAWCQEHLEPSICRGEYKAVTGREHVNSDRVREAHQEEEARLKKTAKEQAEQKNLLQREAQRLVQLKASLQSWSAALEQQAAEHAEQQKRESRAHAEKLRRATEEHAARQAESEQRQAERWRVRTEELDRRKEALGNLPARAAAMKTENTQLRDRLNDISAQSYEAGLTAGEREGHRLGFALGLSVGVEATAAAANAWIWTETPENYARRFSIDELMATASEQALSEEEALARQEQEAKLENGSSHMNVVAGP